MNANEASENTSDEAFTPPSPSHIIRQMPEKHRKATEGDPITVSTSEYASIVELQIVMFSIDVAPCSSVPVPIPEPSDEYAFTYESEIKRTPIEELRSSFATVPIPAPRPEALAATVEFQIAMLSIRELCPDPPGPVPIPDPSVELLASIIELQIVMHPTDNIAGSYSYSTPVPIPEPPDELAFTYEAEMNRSPIDESPPYAHPVPIPAPSPEALAAIVEFQIAILSTVDVVPG
jgi:hypothetical protein